MKMPLVLLALLLLTPAVFSADCPPGTVATTALPAPVHLSYDFATWPQESFLMAREERFPTAGEFYVTDRGLRNRIPDGVEEKDLIAAKDGVGVASAIIRDLSIADVRVDCSMAFEAKGAPSVLLRAQLQDGVLGKMYSLVLYDKGLNLWFFNGEKWAKAASTQFEVEAGKAHDVRVMMKGKRCWVAVDGDVMLETRELEFTEAGAIGIWAGEGPCTFGDMRVRYTSQ